MVQPGVSLLTRLVACVCFYQKQPHKIGEEKRKKKKPPQQTNKQTTQPYLRGYWATP